MRSFASEGVSGTPERVRAAIWVSARKYGGSVCESNAPLTSETPIAGFEDREDHRTPFASAKPASWVRRGLLIKASFCRVKVARLRIKRMQARPV